MERFPEISENSINELVENRLSKKSKDCIKWSVEILSEYAIARKVTLNDIEQMNTTELDLFLSKFYAEVRAKNGNFYTKNGMLSLRYGVQKNFSKKFDIINDLAFKYANKTFAAVLVNLKREGKGKVIHKEPITKEDFTRLYSSEVLNLSTPEGLQNKIFVDLMMHLCNRGRENLRDMKCSDFKVCIDSNNNRYVVMNDMLTKNHRGDGRDGNSQEGRMYATPGNLLCPVTSFEKYMQKLNRDVDCFWQKPNNHFDLKKNTVWYVKVPLGKNILGDKMKTLSKLAGLSITYTNHCLRATCITTLDKQGFEARQIMSVSGQKSETSIRSYSRHVSEQKKREMSLALSNHMTGTVNEANAVSKEQENMITEESVTIRMSTSAQPYERVQFSDVTNVPQEQKIFNFNFSNCSVNIHN
jgi:hypothetical protein